MLKKMMNNLVTGEFTTRGG